MKIMKEENTIIKYLKKMGEYRMEEFHDICKDDLGKIEDLVYENHIMSSLYSTYNLYRLRNKYKTKICYYEDKLLIYQENRKTDKYDSYLYPIGKNNINNSINMLYQYAKTKNKDIVLWGLTDKMVYDLEKTRPNEFQYEEIPNWADYIYEKEKLMNAKVLKKSRKFSREYKDNYEIEKLNKTNFDDVIEFQNKWMKTNARNNDDIISLNYENDSIIETLENWDDIPLRGYCIKINGKIVGFIYGFQQTIDCYTIHVIKTDKSIKGLTLFLFKYFVENSNTKYINFEEDIGIEGLRIFKTRLEPSFIKKV